MIWFYIKYKDEIITDKTVDNIVGEKNHLGSEKISRSYPMGSNRHRNKRKKTIRC